MIQLQPIAKDLATERGVGVSLLAGVNLLESSHGVSLGGVKGGAKIRSTIRSGSRTNPAWLCYLPEQRMVLGGPSVSQEAASASATEHEKWKRLGSSLPKFSSEPGASQVQGTTQG